MTPPSIRALGAARAAAFGLTGALLLGLAAFVLVGGPEGLRLSWWSWPAGLALFAVVGALGLAGGPKARRVLWDEAAEADHARSQRWAYLLAILAIFPLLAVSILLGLDPLRGFVAAGLLLGGTQLALFCAFDRIGR
jgi:hypothetical protein